MSSVLHFFSMTLEFLEVFLPQQKGKSPCTIKNYKDSLSQFRRYLLEEKNISVNDFSFAQCTRDCVMGFLDYLTKTGRSAGTRNQRLAAIHSYLVFASDKNLSLQSVALSISKIPYTRGVEPVRTILSENAVAAILSMPPVTPKGIRDTTIMVVLYDSAIRIAELLDLRMGNVHLDNDEPYIRVMGKGSKERIISISDGVAAHLNNYFKYYRETFGGPKTDLIFYSVIRGEPGKMSEANVERLLQQYADKARAQCKEIPERVYPHMMRRSKATHMYQNGIALPLVSRILGHSSMDTTKIYAVPSMKMMREAVNSIQHPSTKDEQPAWKGQSETEMARLYGLR